MSVHIPVLMDEVISGLDLQSGDVVVDGTINGGGHAFAISQHLSRKGILIGIDQDSNGLEVSRKKLKNVSPTVHLVHNNTRELDAILENLGITEVNKILLDLGWSSNQFENPERGFSFMHDGPLRMTLGDQKDQYAFTAHDIINTWEIESLIDIFEGYGEERFARRIATAIADAREKKAIEGTLELAEIITQAIPHRLRKSSLHPATKVFQALRITVNDEMQALKEMLEKGFQALAPKGRMVVISFHSIEDRIVKHYFKKLHAEGQGEVLTKKPITASSKELEANNRARSAKLRILKKI